MPLEAARGSPWPRCAGVLRLQSIAACPARPAYLAVALDAHALYAVHELDQGLVSAFAIGDGGDLRLLGTQPSGGAQPCHLSVHPSGRYVLSAHWGSGSIVVHPAGWGSGARWRCTAAPAPVTWPSTRKAPGSTS